MIFCFRSLRSQAALALVAFAASRALAALSLQQTATEFRVRNDDAVLVLARDHWRLSLTDANGATRFTDAAAPAFQIGGAWQEFARVESADAQPESVRFRVALANAGAATAEVTAFGRSGFRVLVRADAGATATAVRGATALDVVEEVYGFGEMWNGRVAQRGAAFELWDRGGTPDECAYMPYYVSTRNYAWFLNYGGRVRFDVGRRRADQIAFEAPAHELDLTLVRGESLPGTVQNFLTQVGLPPLPPRWSFQPWFWLMSDPAQPSGKIDTLKGHHSLEMVDKLRELSIPVGVTWFEPPWQDARTSFIPNREFDADLKGLIAKLADRGVRTLAWTVPYTTNTASNWREAVEHRYLAAKPGASAADANAKVAISASGELAERRLASWRTWRRLWRTALF